LELFGAFWCGPSVGVLFGAQRRLAWSMKTSEEAESSSMFCVEFFGSKRKTESS